MKQETLEEVAERYVDNFEYGIAHPKRVCKNAFINGAKWQQERSYSQDDLELRKKLWVDVYIAYVSTPNSYNRDGGYVWADKALERFDEQFKKK